MSGDGVPTRITKLELDNYMQWSLKLEHIMRLRGCWSSVAPLITPKRPAAGGGANLEPRIVTERQAKPEEQTRSLIALDI